MKIFKTISLLLVISVVISGCDLKININPDEKDVDVSVTEQEKTEPNTDFEDVSLEPVALKIEKDEESMLLSLTYGDVMFKDFEFLCGQPMMLFAQPQELESVILNPLSPGSDQPVKKIYKFDLTSGNCQEMEISQILADFGVRVLSPDQKFLAVSLETDEAKELQLLDLVNDKSSILVELEENETLNGGYGALANHFDIQWIDNQKIQYTVFEDTIKNYSSKATEKIEDVLQVRVIDIE